MKRFLDKEISLDQVYSIILKMLFWSFPIGLFGGLMLGFFELYIGLFHKLML